jgi:spore coat polysaccharide biosynthesis protein SpsF (cytidylyltransferase family)
MFKNKKVVAIIQLHHNQHDYSLHRITNKAIVDYQIDNLLRSRYIDTIIIAVPDFIENKCFSVFQRERVNIYYGSNEPQQRIEEAAKLYGAEIIVHTNGNQPLMNSPLIDKTMEKMDEKQLNYISAFSSYLPIGLSFKISNSIAIHQCLRDKQLYDYTWFHNVFKERYFYIGYWDCRIYNDDTYKLCIDYITAAENCVDINSLITFYDSLAQVDQDILTDDKKRILYYPAPALEEKYNKRLINYFIKQGYVIDLFITDISTFYSFKDLLNLEKENIRVIILSNMYKITSEKLLIDIDLEECKLYENGMGIKWPNNECIKYANLIYEYYQKYTPEFVVMKNNLFFKRNILLQISNIFEKKVIVTEQGYIRTPVSYSQSIDLNGVNYGGHFASTYRHIKLIDSQENEVKNFLQKYHKIVLPKTKSLFVKGRYLFLALQVETDTQIICYSQQYKKMAEVVRDVLNNKPKDYDLIIKPHPFWQDSLFLEELYEMIKDNNDTQIHLDTNTHELIQNSSAVIVINSTVGFEALTYYKPVISLGNAIYSKKGITLDVKNVGQLKDALMKIHSYEPDSEKINSFIYQVIHDYLFIYKTDKEMDMDMDDETVDDFGNRLLKFVQLIT